VQVTAVECNLQAVGAGGIFNTNAATTAIADGVVLVDDAAVSIDDHLEGFRVACTVMRHFLVLDDELRANALVVNRPALGGVQVVPERSQHIVGFVTVGNTRV